MADTSDYATIAGRHAGYKAGQQIVMTWLVKQAAPKCDLTAYLSSLARLDPNDCNDTLRVATHEILGLAEVAVKSPPPTAVPQDVYQILEDVIAGRQAANIWYSSQPRSTDHDGHLFFISTLQKLRDLLGCARCDEEVTQNHLAQKPKKSAKQAPKEANSPANIFARLDVHEPGDEPLGTFPVACEPKLKELPKFTVDDETDQDMFALWCFLEDMNDVRTLLRELWHEVRLGDTTLGIAGLVTEIGFGVIHRAYNEFVEANPQFPDRMSITDFLQIQEYINHNVVYLLPDERRDITTPSSAQEKAADLLCTAAHFLLRAYMYASRNCSLSANDPNGLRNGPVDGKFGSVSVFRPASRFESVLFSMVPELASMKQYSELVYEPNGPCARDWFSEDGKQHLYSRHCATSFTDGLLQITPPPGGLD